jgi:hypothetical protein
MTKTQAPSQHVKHCKFRNLVYARYPALRLTVQIRSLQNQTDRPLLRFPADLRNRVHGYAFGEEEEYAICDCHSENRPDLNLLETCRQIHAETKYLPFTSNTFVGCTEHITTFPVLLEPNQLDAITTIGMSFGRGSLVIRFDEQGRDGFRYLQRDIQETLLVVGEMQGLKKLVLSPVMATDSEIVDMMYGLYMIYGFQKAEWKDLRDKCAKEVVWVFKRETSRSGEIEVVVASG